MGTGKARGRSLAWQMVARHDGPKVTLPNPGPAPIRRSRGVLLALIATLPLACASSPAAKHPASLAKPAGGRPEQRCFLLFELGVGQVRRAPSEACGTRVTPASTFKIP